MVPLREGLHSLPCCYANLCISVKKPPRGLRPSEALLNLVGMLIHAKDSDAAPSGQSLRGISSQEWKCTDWWHDPDR